MNYQRQDSRKAENLEISFWNKKREIKQYAAETIFSHGRFLTSPIISGKFYEAALNRKMVAKQRKPTRQKRQDIFNLFRLYLMTLLKAKRLRRIVYTRP